MMAASRIAAAGGGVYVKRDHIHEQPAAVAAEAGAVLPVGNVREGGGLSGMRLRHLLKKKAKKRLTRLPPFLSEQSDPVVHIPKLTWRLLHCTPNP